jgi:hypothetical protein
MPLAPAITAGGRGFASSVVDDWGEIGQVFRAADDE